MVKIALKKPMKEVHFSCDQVRILHKSVSLFLLLLALWVCAYQQPCPVQTLSEDKALEMSAAPCVVAGSRMLL